MLEFLFDSIFVQCGKRVHQQTVAIPSGTNYAPQLADICLHSYGTDFIANLIQKGKNIV